MVDLADQFKDTRNMSAVQAVKVRVIHKENQNIPREQRNLTSKRHLKLNGSVIGVIGLAT